jgi:hypothetical protein
VNRLDPRVKLGRLFTGRKGFNHAQLNDRRGRPWWACHYFMVRAELIEGVDTTEDQPWRPGAARLLRQVVEQQAWPVGAPGGWPGERRLLIDATRSVLAMRFNDGPNHFGFVYLDPDKVRLIEAAAGMATRAVWGLTAGDDGMHWEGIGAAAPIVLRRNRDRMAVAVLSTLCISRPWDLTEAEVQP